MCSRISLPNRGRHQKEGDVLHFCAHMTFPCSQWPNPCPGSCHLLGERNLTQSFLAGFVSSRKFCCHNSNSAFYLGNGNTQLQRWYRKKWVIMNYKEQGKYLNSCAATEGAIKRKKPSSFFYSHLLAVLNASPVNSVV